MTVTIYTHKGKQGTIDQIRAMKAEDAKKPKVAPKVAPKAAPKAAPKTSPKVNTK